MHLPATYGFTPGPESDKVDGIGLCLALRAAAEGSTGFSIKLAGSARPWRDMIAS